MSGSGTPNLRKDISFTHLSVWSYALARSISVSPTNLFLCTASASMNFRRYIGCAVDFPRRNACWFSSMILCLYHTSTIRFFRIPTHIFLITFCSFNGRLFSWSGFPGSFSVRYISSFFHELNICFLANASFIIVSRSSCNSIGAYARCA